LSAFTGFAVLEKCYTEIRVGVDDFASVEASEFNRDQRAISASPQLVPLQLVAIYAIQQGSTSAGIWFGGAVLITQTGKRLWVKRVVAKANGLQDNLESCRVLKPSEQTSHPHWDNIIPDQCLQLR
jgi:hypothetical protein